MHRILRIDSSARVQGSYSRELGDALEAQLSQQFGGAVVARRDVALEPVQHISHDTINGMFTPPDQATVEMKAALANSDALIAQVKEADSLLITVPMYNFGIPSSLKAWIDQIARIGHTFSYDGKTFTGLLGGRTVYIIIAYGAAGYASGEGFAAANHVEPYLKFLFGFLGVDSVVVFNDQGTNTNRDGIASQHQQIAHDMQAKVAEHVQRVRSMQTTNLAKAA